MLSSNRTTNPRVDEPDQDTELWERLRIQADRRSSEYPSASSLPPSLRQSGWRSTPQSQPMPSPTYVEDHEVESIEDMQYTEYGASPFAEPTPAPEAPSWGRATGVQSAFGGAPPSLAPVAPVPAPVPSSFDAESWGSSFDVPAMESIEVAPRARSRWLMPAIAVVSVLGLGLTGYQFVLLPRQEQERAAAYAALEAQQRRLLEEQRAAAEANERAEAEKRAADEAIARAEQAAAAADASKDASPTARGGKVAGDSGRASAAADESRSERRARERHERREARRAARAARHASRRHHAARASADESEHRSSKRRSSSASRPVADDRDDPLAGI